MVARPAALNPDSVVPRRVEVAGGDPRRAFGSAREPSRLLVFAGEPVAHAGHIARNPSRSWEPGQVVTASARGAAFECRVDELAFAERAR